MSQSSTIDRVLSVNGVEGRAVRNVPNTLTVLATHFPRFPVLPGVMILDSVVELATCVAGRGWQLDRAERLTFRHFVRPGDQMEIVVRILERSPEVVAVSGNVSVAGRSVMTARRIELTRAVEP